MNRSERTIGTTRGRSIGRPKRASPPNGFPEPSARFAMIVNVQLTLFAVLILEAESLGISVDHVIKAFLNDRVRFSFRSGT